jgi:hypothetical protein
LPISKFGWGVKPPLSDHVYFLPRFYGEGDREAVETLSTQKSGFSACGTALSFVMKVERKLSAQTVSSHSPEARRYVALADQGIVKTPGSSTVN